MRFTNEVRMRGIFIRVGGRPVLWFTMKDPKFVAAAKQANVYFNPIGREELQRIVGR
jgi:hypothetical protein